MNFPDNLKYTKDHEWVKVDGDVATVGITEFAQQELGEIVFADIPAVGKSFKQGETLCVVESTKAASDVYAPISGTVVEGNLALAASPDRINTSSYADGWLVKLDKFDSGELEKLMSAAEYKKHLGDKI